MGETLNAATGWIVGICLFLAVICAFDGPTLAPYPLIGLAILAVVARVVAARFSQNLGEE